MDQMTQFECPQGCGALVRTFRQGVPVLACPQCGGWMTQAALDRSAAGVITSLAQEIIAAGGCIPRSWEG